MIVGARRKKPFISFGMDATEKTIQEAGKATVWLQSIFREDVYDFSLIHPEFSIVKKSNYEWECTPTVKGVFTFEVTVVTKNKAKEKIIILKSNTITLIVD